MDQCGLARRQTPLRWLSRAALAGTAMATVVIIGQAQTLPNSTQVTLVVLASVGYLAMLAADHRWGGLNLGLVVTAGVVTALAALEWTRALHR